MLKMIATSLYSNWGPPGSELQSRIVSGRSKCRNMDVTTAIWPQRAVPNIIMGPQLTQCKLITLTAADTWPTKIKIFASDEKEATASMVIYNCLSKNDANQYVKILIVEFAGQHKWTRISSCPVQQQVGLKPRALFAAESTF